MTGFDYDVISSKIIEQCIFFNVFFSCGYFQAYFLIVLRHFKDISIINQILLNNLITYSYY